MTITQIVKIPANNSTIEIPREIPAGEVIITFTTAPLDTVADCPICAKNRDPITGNPRYNVATIAAMEESRAAMRGEIPAKWHKPHEFEQVWKEMLED